MRSQNVFHILKTKCKINERADAFFLFFLLFLIIKSSGFFSYNNSNLKCEIKSFNKQN